jgi:hypothetical protein
MDFSRWLDDSKLPAQDVFEGVLYFEQVYNAAKKQEEWRCLLCATGPMHEVRATEHCASKKHAKKYQQLLAAHDAKQQTERNPSVTVKTTKPNPVRVQQQQQPSSKKRVHFNKQWLSAPLKGTLASFNVPYAELVKGSNGNQWVCHLCDTGSIETTNMEAHCRSTQHADNYVHLAEAAVQYQQEQTQQPEIKPQQQQLEIQPQQQPTESSAGSYAAAVLVPSSAATAAVHPRVKVVATEEVNHNNKQKDSSVKAATATTTSRPPTAIDASWLITPPRGQLVFENVAIFETTIATTSGGVTEYKCKLCDSGRMAAVRALDHVKGGKHEKNYKRLVEAYQKLHGTAAVAMSTGSSVQTKDFVEIGFHKENIKDPSWLSFKPLGPLVYDGVPYFEKIFNTEKNQDEWQCIMCGTGLCPANRALDHCRGTKHVKNYKNLVLAYNHEHGTNIPLPVPFSNNQIVDAKKKAEVQTQQLSRETIQVNERKTAEPLKTSEPVFVTVQSVEREIATNTSLRGEIKPRANVTVADLNMDTSTSSFASIPKYGLSPDAPDYQPHKIDTQSKVEDTVSTTAPLATTSMHEDAQQYHSMVHDYTVNKSVYHHMNAAVYQQQMMDAAMMMHMQPLMQPLLPGPILQQPGFMYVPIGGTSAGIDEAWLRDVPRGLLVSVIAHLFIIIWIWSIVASNLLFRGAGL